MPAIEIMTVMKDQKPAGANVALLGRMSPRSSKNGSQNDFIGMMQLTMSEYESQDRNQSRTDENTASGSHDDQAAKIFSIKNEHPARDKGKSKRGEGIASSGELTAKPANENTTDEQGETAAMPVFDASLIEKIIARSMAARSDAPGAPSVLAIPKEDRGGLAKPKDVLALLNETADSLGRQHQGILASPAKRSHPVMETDLNTIPELKKQLVAALEEKGLSARKIRGIMKAVEETAFKVGPVDQPLETINQQKITNELVTVMEGKGIPAGLVAGILEELDQVIMDKAPLARQNVKELDQVIAIKAPDVKLDKTGKHPINVGPASPSFRQAAEVILEKKGFSADDIKGILQAVDQAMVVGVKAGVERRSDRSVFNQQSFYHKELIKEAGLGRKNIHADIYQKEASLDDFRQKSAEAKVIINPLEKKTVSDGQQKETVGKLENTGRSEKKDVFAGVMKGTENKKSIGNDKEAAPQAAGKVITATAQDDQGKSTKMAGDVKAKTNHRNHEDMNLNVEREQGPISSDIMRMAAKGAEINSVKTAMDNSKSVYQSVVDQIQDGFALAQNKDNGQVRLTLKPEMMGHLDMQIAVRNEAVQIMMTVENEKVHQAMNAHIDDLKSALQSQGLKIDKIEVTLQNQPDPGKSFYQDQAKSQFNNPGQNSHHERMINQELSFGDAHYAIDGQEIIQKQGSTEGVSIFA